MPETEGELKLPDGRSLGYAEYGDPSGGPVFYFHGFPASRIEARLTHEAACRAGVRIIAADRPGFGLSDFLEGRAMENWPRDVVDLADALAIDRFGVLGISGGGPYALVCACRIPQRLTTAGIVGGLGPLEAPQPVREMQPLARFSFFLARRTPGLMRLFYEGLLGPFLHRFPGFSLRLLSASAPVEDRKVLSRAEVRKTLTDSIREAFRQGARGATQELVLYSRPWGFDLRTIRVKVRLWHGERDATVPVSMGRYLAEKIPGCSASFLPDEGHFSLPVDHAEEILRALRA